MMIGMMVQIVAMIGSTEAHILLVHFLNNRSYTGLSTSLSNRVGLFPKREVADLLALLYVQNFRPVSSVGPWEFRPHGRSMT